MFSLIPIGTNGLFPTKDKPTSCYYIEAAGKKIVLDMGSGSFEKLCERVSPEEIDLIIVSHFHLDHCADLGVFGYYNQKSGTKTRVFCPFDPSAFALFSLNKHFSATEIKEGVFGFDGIRLEFFRTRHPVETYAVRITAEGKTLSYTADSNVFDNLDKVFSGSDLVISDSAFLFSDWSEEKPHISARHCGEYSARYRVKTLLSHLNPRADEKAVLSEAEKISDLCELIENGKVYNL